MYFFYSDDINSHHFAILSFNCKYNITTIINQQFFFTTASYYINMNLLELRNFTDSEAFPCASKIVVNISHNSNSIQINLIKFYYSNRADTILKA